ncbi:hypothetical protein C8F04DRAFT_1133678 [Mycena alexandri]|uniref:Uncharacterized protein n=1 Tax=Mycena alexandri TaxID=1745969 RepID=A0AAD6SCF4_9AGAR|nr:hypothetical protein C8F04DRAFT_1133678 [Mycena alexandri]
MHMRTSTTFFKALTLILPLLGPGSQKLIFTTFVEEFYVTRDIPRAFSHIAADYIQHNPVELDGVTSSFDFLDPIFSNTSVTVQILHRVFEAAILDLFRFDGTCVQEHWDVIQERPVNAPNPHALF